MTNKLLELINLVDNVPLDFEHNHAPYYCLLVGSTPRPYGYIHPDTIARMPWPPAFAVSHASRTVTLTPPADAPADYLNSSFQQAIDAALANDTFPILSGMHSEPFRVVGIAQSPSTIVHLERFAASLFGIATRGAHMTCYVPATADQPLRIWVARRSRSIRTYPGKLDSTVAGGVKAPDSPWECILAEAHEEAALPEEAVRRAAIHTGVVTVANRNLRTDLFHGEILYVYDMNMSLCGGLEPRLGDDGEVDTFELMDVAQVRTLMEQGEFKPNVCSVMIDFMIRHGVVSPETEGEEAFVAMCARLRRSLPFAGL